MTTDDKPPDPELAGRMTLRHLAIFDRQIFLFRALPDSRELKGQAGPAPFMFTGTIKRHYRTLQEHNKAGYGIFVQPNVSDGKGYREPNIISAPCLFADLDKVPIENLDRFPIEPHLIVETSPGKYHAYWRVADIPLDRFSDLQRRLADLFGSDPVVHDLPRMLRLAGFYHMKKPQNPFLSRIIEQ